MSSSSVFWQMFTVTGEIGYYLLYKYTGAQALDKNGDLNSDEEQDHLSEVASERG